MENELHNQLIIKAPDQNVDDQIIKCSFNWTIRELKKHLSKVYPNRPHVSEQKLIYGGQLLHNHLRLRDILRQEEKDDEERQSVQTFHLVCVCSHWSPENSEHRAHSSQNCSEFLQSSDESLRRRNTAGNATASGSTDQQVTVSPVTRSPLDNSQMPYVQQMYANYVGQQNQIPGFAPVIPQFPTYDVASQMVAYQQFYANYYAQFIQNLQGVPANNVPVVPGPQFPNVIPAVENAMDGIIEPPPQMHNQNLRMNAQGGPLIDDNGNRDWLDYFYLWCRGFILFSIVYFYSSPERLLLVISLALLGFLYQEGWILARVRNNQVPQNARPQQQQQRPQPRENPNEDEQNEDANNLEEGVQEIEAAMDGDEPPHMQNQDATRNNAHSFWTVIVSFFSSLIPDPPPPVNIN